LIVDNSVALSSVAVCLSLFSVAFTAYQQYFKRPVITVLVGQRMSAYYEHDGRLYLHITLVFRNRGAQYGTIRAVGGQISERTKKHSRSAPIKWVAFLRDQHMNLAKLGEAFRPFAATESYAEMLVVPSRTVVTKRVQFITTEPFELSRGSYLLEFGVFEGLRKSFAATTTAIFDVPEEVINRLRCARADKETHIASNTVIIPLEMKV
jgi:hypothetical protein